MQLNNGAYIYIYTNIHIYVYIYIYKYIPVYNNDLQQLYTNKNNNINNK